MTDYWPEELDAAVQRHPAGKSAAAGDTGVNTGHPNTIDHLDFRVGCLFCGQPAQYDVERHAVDSCNRPGLGPDGNWITPLCRTCLKRVYADTRSYLAMAHVGIFRMECQGCGAPIRQLEDVLRDVREL